MILSLLLACTAPAPTDTAEPTDTAPEDTGGDTAADTGADTADTGELADRGLRLGIPSYAHPTSVDWPLFVAGAAATGGFVIINPSSGPGGVVDAAYVTAVVEAQAQGVVVIGYVATTYGDKTAGQVDTEIGRYVDWYGVDGIFFDEVSSDCTTWASRYAARAGTANTLLGHDAWIVYNPGVITCAEYLDAADVLVVVEGARFELLEWAAEPWMADYRPERFAYLGYEVPSQYLGETLSAVVAQGVGFVYVTDGRPPNPWLQTPRYWDEEVAAVEAN